MEVLFQSNKMRGHAVMIINEKAVADAHFVERTDAYKYDADNLQRAFCTKLNFNWLNQGPLSRDLSKAEWMHSNEQPPNCDCVTCLIQNTDHSKSECFLLVISSHGRELEGEQQIGFSDGGKVKLSEIIKTLRDENCVSLKGKPRILILQACRTNYDLPEAQRKDPGHDVKVDVKVLADAMEDLDFRKNDNDDAHPENGNETGKGAVHSYGVTGEEEPQVSESSLSSEESDADVVEDENHAGSVHDIPENFLIVFPTTAGKTAYRRTEAKRDADKGSWLIVELCNVIDDHKFEEYPEMNFLKILTEATGRIARNWETKKTYKSAPCIMHRLTAPLIFRDVATDIELGTSNKPALF